MHRQPRLLRRSIFSVIARSEATKQSLILLFIFFFFFTQAHAQLEALKDLYERAVDAYDKHQYTEATDLYQKIIKFAPGFVPAYNGLALANQSANGDEDKTIQYLKTAISYDPKLAQAYDNLGRIYYGRQDADQAEEYFNKALNLNPGLTSAQMSLAWINLLIRSKPMTALKYFEMVPFADRNPKVYYGMGSAYFATNQRVKAMEIITKLHEMGQEDLATRLETSMRDNTKVNIQPDSTQGTSLATPPGLGPLAPTSDAPTGMKVHLRGKLADY
jgi:tetratricopeptide (TPR) repeat protein